MQRGSITGVDTTNKIVTATLLGGATVDAPWVGALPVVGDNNWFLEVSSGAWLCLGTLGATTATAATHASSHEIAGTDELNWTEKVLLTQVFS